MDSSVKEEALALVNQINNRCQVEVEGLTFQDLATKDWYLHILWRLCDYMADKLSAIQKQPNQPKAINDILVLINELDQFAEDVTEEINGEEVAAGNPEQIFYMVQVIAALVDAAEKENELGDEVSDGNNQEGPSVAQSGNQNVKKQKQSGEKPQRQKRSHSFDNRMNRSAQGIDDEFQKSEEQSEDSHQKMVKYNLKDPHYPQMVESIPHPQFDIEDSPVKQTNKYAALAQNNMDKSNPDDDSIQYLEQKMSQTKMLKKKTSPPKINDKRGLKKNPQKNALIYGDKRSKQLITHPKTPQKLKKAKSQQQIQLTKKMQHQIKKTKKKTANMKSQNDYLKRGRSPVDNQLKRKGKQIQYIMNDRATQKKQIATLKKKRKSHAQKNERNLMKMLNWREEQMKKQRQQYEESMKMKVQLQKETYVKQINDLIIKLEKEKEIQEKKDFKDNLIRQNDEAVKRMTALDQWYKNKIDLIKENRKNKRQQRQMIKTGHKEIIGQIEKQLKKQNQEKLMKLTMRYRSEQENIQNDLEQLTQKIIKVYKKN